VHLTHDYRSRATDTTNRPSRSSSPSLSLVLSVPLVLVFLSSQLPVILHLLALASHGRPFLIITRSDEGGPLGVSSAQIKAQRRNVGDGTHRVTHLTFSRADG